MREGGRGAGGGRVGLGYILSATVEQNIHNSYIHVQHSYAPSKQLPPSLIHTTKKGQGSKMIPARDFL